MGCVAIKEKEVKGISPNESVALSTASSRKEYEIFEQTIKISHKIVL